ncbi:MAG TPA: glycosyltransferase family 4 protein [Trueperaceae bacterium]
MEAPRVALLNLAHDPGVREPESTLQAFPVLTEFASGLSRAGAAVIVVQRHASRAELARDGVSYVFVGGAGRGRPRSVDACLPVLRRVAGLRPDVVHVHGLVFPLPVRALRRLLPEAALVVQHHGEGPWLGWRGALQRWGLAAADGFMFTARGLAEPWRARGVVGPAQPVFEVMEGSTGLVPVPRDQARGRVPLPGRPALLWVGRLHPVKDPLTLLEGLELLLHDCPEAHLTMVFGEADQLGEVEARLRASRRLRDATTLVGRVPHGELAWYYASADYYVAASRREGSGFALAEALGSGLVPIVTDIPSFAWMTDGGRLGGLWRPGDAADFARVARAVLARPREELSRAAVEQYRRRLSTEAIGRDALAVYRSVLERRGSRGR